MVKTHVAGGPDSAGRRKGFLSMPSTKFGWWSVNLAVMFVGLLIINIFIFTPIIEKSPWRQYVLPFYGISMLLCGLAAGITGFIAIVRRHERSWLVWLTMLPGLMVFTFLLGEILVPH